MSQSSSALTPAFHRLALSNLAAQVSEQVALAAAPLVAVLVLGAGASGTGYLQTAQTLPFLLLSLPAGVLADRTSRRRLMVIAEALRTLSLTGIMFLILSGLLDLFSLAALGFIGTIGTVAYTVAAPALIPNLVSRNQLAAANRWLELARSGAFAAGPALGGALVSWSGASVAYALSTALSLLTVMLLLGLPELARSVRPHRHVVQELNEGASFVLGHPLLRPVLFTAIFFNTAWFILQAVYVAYAVQRLELSPTTIGLTLGVYGAGMVAGAIVAPRLTMSLSFGHVIAAGPLSALLASGLMSMTTIYPSGVLAGVSFFLFGAGPTLWAITTATLRQSVTPNELLGRVSAVITTVTFGARPVGAAIAAVLAANYNVEICLWASTAGFIVQFVILFMSQVPRLKHQPQAV